MVQQTHWEQAHLIYREVLECCIRRSGAHHPSPVAAKGDLSAILFELGEDDDAEQLEREAFQDAQTHLGNHHAVTSVLAWNRALRFEKAGRVDAARTIVLKQLSWLLTRDGADLEDEQKTIQTMLAQRLDWDTATPC